MYAFDVESHNDSESIAKNETSVWLYSFINEESRMDDENSYGYDLDHFLDTLKEKTDRHRTSKERPVSNLMIYVYNLSFEWSFLFPYILKRGFKFKAKIESTDENVWNSVTTKSASSVWQIELKFGKKSGVVVFHDLCKIYPGGLGKVARSMGLPTQKGEIDYMKNRLHGYTVTKEEKEYCFKDTRIVVDILLLMQKKDDRDFFKSCSAATYACRKMIRYGWPKSYKPMKEFRKSYPLLGEEESNFLRNGVAGGITYSPSLWQFKDIRQNIIHIDAHQMHPSSAYLNNFPYGKGKYFKGKPPTDHAYISCLHIKCSYSHVKLHSVIKLIGQDIGQDEEITIWSFELPVMKKCYDDFKYEIIDGYAYRCKRLPWRKFYEENYKERLKAKKEGNGYEVARRKLLNNASYGKLEEHGHDIILQNVLTPDEVIDSVAIAKADASINAAYTYIPVGSCIAAYSRVKLISTALLFGWKNIVYFDTDSIFAIKNEETMKALSHINMKDHLGGWGLEKEISRGQFTAPKRYKIEELQDDGSSRLVAHVAGVNFHDETPTYEDLDLIDAYYDVQCIRRCKGGTLIIMNKKHLSVQKKYSLIYQNNV